jgi:hypothetical protein
MAREAKVKLPSDLLDLLEPARLLMPALKEG